MDGFLLICPVAKKQTNKHITRLKGFGFFLPPDEGLNLTGLRSENFSKQKYYWFSVL